MTFLEICRALAAEAGVAGGEDAITTVANVTGEARRIVGWAADAWLEIQGQQHWSFRWEQPTITVLAGNSTLATGIPERRYSRTGTWILKPAEANDIALDFLPWQDFQMIYRRLLTDDNVTAWTVKPNGEFALNAKVTADTDILVERWGNPVRLAADGDVPALPEHLHKIIVWRALMLYANFDEAGAQRQTALDEYATLHRQLCDECLPTMEFGGPMLIE